MTLKPKRGRPKAFHDKTAQNTIQSLDRALTVLTHVAQNQDCSLTELAQALDQSPATLYRVLVTLAGHNMVEMEPSEQTWHIGPGAFRVGSAFLRRSSLVERARPAMRQLMEMTGETANIAVERNGRVLFLGQVETHESIRAFFPPGTQAPMHTSGIGKAILAQFEAARVKSIFESEDTRVFTPHSLGRLDALAADLAEIRNRGFAVDNEEKTLGMRCIAAPVFGADGRAIAGLSISGPVSRVTPDRVAEIGAAVQQAAQALSVAMGGGPEHAPLIA